MAVDPGRYNYAPTFSKDGSAGPDGGTLPLSSQCDWAFHSNREGGNDQAASWSVVPYPGSQPYSMCAVPRPLNQLPQLGVSPSVAVS